MKPREVKIGDLLRHTGFGLCIVQKFFAPSFIAVIIIDNIYPSETGTWRYIRGFEFENLVLVARGQGP